MAANVCELLRVFRSNAQADVVLWFAICVAGSGVVRRQMGDYVCELLRVFRSNAQAVFARMRNMAADEHAECIGKGNPKG